MPEDPGSVNLVCVRVQSSAELQARSDMQMLQVS